MATKQAIKKDIVVVREDGLYAMVVGECDEAELRWTNKANAQHFTGKAAAKRSLPGLHHFTVTFDDLKSKKKRGK